MSARRQPYFTIESYRALEESSDARHEYVHGEIRAMAGASKRHHLLVNAVQFSLYGQTRQRPCNSYATDTRVGSSGAGFYAYPDVVVVCGQERYDDKLPDTITNPLVIVEVLSPSTADYDLGTKFRLYQMLETLQDYLLVSQDRVRVDHYHRDGEQWTLRAYTQLTDVIALISVDCALRLAEVYEKVDFSAGDER